MHHQQSSSSSSSLLRDDSVQCFPPPFRRACPHGEAGKRAVQYWAKILHNTRTLLRSSGHVLTFGKHVQGGTKFVATAYMRWKCACRFTIENKMRQTRACGFAREDKMCQACAYGFPLKDKLNEKCSACGFRVGERECARNVLGALARERECARNVLGVL